MVAGFICMIPFQTNLYTRIGTVFSLSAALLVIIFTRYYEKGQKQMFILHDLLILFFVFQIARGLAVNMEGATDRVVEMIINLIWGYFIYRYFRERSIKTAFWVLWVALAFLAAFQIIVTGGHLRDEVTNFNVNSLGLLCGYAVGFALYMYFTEKKLRYLPVAALFFFIVILTASRQALIAVLIPSILILINKNKKNRFFRALLVLLVAFLLIEMMLTIPVLYNTVGYRIENAIQGVFNGSSDEESMHNRMMHYEQAMELIKKKPFFGYGLNAYQQLTGSTVYSHSNFMEILLAGGIVGFTLYYLPFAYMLIRLLFKKDKNLLTHLLIGVIATQVFEEYFLVSYYRHFTMILYCLIISMYEKNKEKKCLLKLNNQVILY